MSDSGRPEARLERLSKELDEELGLWRQGGIDPSGIVINGFMLDMQVSTLIQYLIDTGIVDEDSLNISYREKVLAKMREMRPNIMRNKLAQAIGQPKLVDKNGKPIL